MFRFKRNMGNLDRAVRTIVGVTLLTLGPITGFVTSDHLSRILMGVVGSLALISAFLAYCVLYDVTGFGTTKTADGSKG
jgi:hypothetical protein